MSLTHRPVGWKAIEVNAGKTHPTSLSQSPTIRDRIQAIYHYFIPAMPGSSVSPVQRI
jgi:hypothetical protein